MCRDRDGCTAWFWCKDADGQPCFDLQSGSWVNWHGCKLLDIPLLPADAFDPADMKPTSDAAYFRSFATGFIKRAHLQMAAVRHTGLRVALRVNQCCRRLTVLMSTAQ